MREGWERITLGDVLTSTNERLGERLEEPPVFSISKYEGVVLANDYFDKRVASKKLDTYKVLQDQDWAYSTIHIDEGSIARNSHGFEGVVSPMYTTMRWNSEEHDPRYFEHLLRTREMLVRYHDNAQGSINRRRSLPWKTFSQLEVEVPPLHEQRRIVDLIGAVDDAIEEGEAEAEAVSSLLGSLQSDIPCGAPTTMGAVLEGIDNGVTTKSSEQVMGDRRMTLVKASAVHRAHFRPAEVKPVGDMDLPEKARVVEGDLLMTRINTPERVGFVCIARDVPDELYRPDLVWKLRVDESQVLPAYIEHLLSSPKVRPLVSAAASGTSRSMQQISKGRFSTVQITLPTLESQASYVEKCDAARGLVNEILNYAESLRVVRSNLLAALLSGAHEIPDTYDEVMSTVA